MSLVVCKLPKAGLGNQLFPLMKALVFGHLNHQRVVVTGYHRLKIGPYLRREKSKRRYSDYFGFQKGLFWEWVDRWKVNKAGRYIQEAEMPLRIVPEDHLKNRMFVYSEIPDYHDFFSELRNHRMLVKELFWNSLSAPVKERFYKLPLPVIGVHIRMGDFRKLRQGEDFSKLGQVRTPEEYFMDIIAKIRLIHGDDLPVTVFTDGYRHELDKLLSVSNIRMAEGNPDIVDLLLLSRSKIIVTAAGSTFSYWAGFLSDAPVIHHPDHIYMPNRLPSENPLLYEGPMNVRHEALVRSIKMIGSES